MFPATLLTSLNAGAALPWQAMVQAGGGWVGGVTWYEIPRNCLLGSSVEKGGVLLPISGHAVIRYVVWASDGGRSPTTDSGRRVRPPHLTRTEAVALAAAPHRSVPMAMSVRLPLGDVACHVAPVHSDWA